MTKQGPVLVTAHLNPNQNNIMSGPVIDYDKLSVFEQGRLQEQMTKDRTGVQVNGCGGCLAFPLLFFMALFVNHCTDVKADSVDTQQTQGETK